MKAIFSVLGLLIVVAVVGVLAKKQMAAVAPPQLAPAQVDAGPGAPNVAPQQQMQQLKQGLEQTLQQARPMADEEKK